MTMSVPPSRRAWALALLALVLPLTAVAAQARDPQHEAQALFDARASAATTAAMLRRDHQRTQEQAALILRAVGYAATPSVAALRREFPSSLSALYHALRVSGYGARETADAFADNFFTLDCLDPQGFPAPCGSFGGTFDAPVTGQVTWHPAPEGTVGAKLYIEASNLPPVFVRIGSVTLVEDKASASAVIVHLPAAPLTGDLKLVRKSDGVVGFLQKDYRVVAPAVPWASYATAATEGAIADMKQWLGGARITGGCVVNGALATAPAGSLSSGAGFAGAVRARLLGAGATTAVASAWESAFQASFLSYTSLVTVPALPLYPGLAAIAADKAPPTPNVPVPLAALASAGAVSMQAQPLGAAVTAALAGVSANDAQRGAAVSAFATAVGGRFNLALLQGLIVNLLGSGPVPGYAPPHAPVGAVAGGSCAGSGIVSMPSKVW